MIGQDFGMLFIVTRGSEFQAYVVDGPKAIVKCQDHKKSGKKQQ